MNSTSDLDVCHDSLYPVSTCDDIGYHFLRSGRPSGVEGRRGRCIVIAVAMFRFPDGDTLSMDFHFWNDVDANKGAHSETLILNRLRETEKKLESSVEVLKLHGSFSPCSTCSGRLIGFLNERPSCRLHLAFSTVYNCEAEKHRSALRKLNAHPQVKTLDVFKEQDWEFLRTRGNLKLSLADKQWMNRFDTFWRMKLHNILQNQNTVSPVHGAKSLGKKTQITKPRRSKKGLLLWSWKQKWKKMRKNKLKNSSVTSVETEKHNSVPAPGNSGQQIHNSAATNTGQQMSVTESLQHVSANTSTNPTEEIIAGNAHRRLKRNLEEIAENREVSEKRARQVQESVALNNSVLSATPSENTANESTNLFVNDNENTKL